MLKRSWPATNINRPVKELQYVQVTKFDLMGMGSTVWKLQPQPLFSVMRCWLRLALRRLLRWAQSAQYNVHQAQAAHRKAMDQQDRSSRACGEVVSDNMGMYGELHSSLEAHLKTCQNVKTKDKTFKDAIQRHPNKYGIIWHVISCDDIIILLYGMAWYCMKWNCHASVIVVCYHIWSCGSAFGQLCIWLQTISS